MSEVDESGSSPSVTVRPGSTPARHWLLTAVACAVVFAASSSAQGPAEPEVRAALVFKLVRFVEWPPEIDRFAHPLEICVAGSEPVRLALGTMAGAPTSIGPRVAVRSVIEAEVRGCDVVYVGAASTHADTILRGTAARPVLTVGEVAGFADRGGMVNLVRDGRHVMLEVNRETLERSGLVLSSLVLSLARTVFR